MKAKQIISSFLAACMLLTALPLTVLAENVATPPQQPTVLYGDADNDKDVDLQDTLLIEKYIAGEKVEMNFTNADINASGTVDKEDLNLLKDYLAGNIESLVPNLCTVTFDTNGGSAVEPVQVGKGYSIIREIQVPTKKGFTFDGWVKPDKSPFYQQDAINTNLTLTATYKALAQTQEINIDSFALMGQETTLSFDVTGDFPSVEEVKNNFTLISKDGSDQVEIEILDIGDKKFTIKAKEGFTPGCSYELTLKSGLNFDGKKENIRKSFFSIKKAQEDKIAYNEDLIFVKDTAEMSYTVNGKDGVSDVLDAAFLSNDKDNKDITGSFNMSNRNFKANDLLCIFENIDPRQRDYTKNSYDEDSLAYIRVTKIEGNKVYFESLSDTDASDILMMPDSIPFKVDTLPIDTVGDEDGSVNKNDYDAYARAKLDIKDAPEFKVGDFLFFYTTDYDLTTESTPAVYAQITKTTGDTAFYKIVTKDYIEDFMGMYVETDIKSEELTKNIDKEELLVKAKKQAIDSGFVDDSTQHMLENVVATDNFNKSLIEKGLTNEDISSLKTQVASRRAAPATRAAAGGSGRGRAKFVVGKPVVTATIIKDGRFENGFGIQLNIKVELSVDKKMSATKSISLKTELTAEFTQEIAIGLKISVKDEWKGEKFLSRLKELSCSTSIDIKSYSAISVCAKIFTVSDDLQKAKWTAVTSATGSPSTQSALAKINKLGVLAKKMKAKADVAQGYIDQINAIKEQLPKVVVSGKEYSIDELEKDLQMTDVSSEFDEVLNAETDDQNKVGLDKLMDKYSQMLENETDWVELYNLSIFEKEFHIKILAIKVSANFFIRANVNVALGADLEYQVGKRYTFWIKLISRTSGSNEMDLLDERFGFQFYVMGTLGLKFGIKLEASVGVFSTSIASIGANVEFGPYLKVWGYFLYIYTDTRPANTEVWKEEEDLMGALYLDFGLFITVKFKAQVFAETFKYEPVLYDGEFPLVSAGVKKNVYGFANEPKENDNLRISDEDNNSLNGIKMALPTEYLRMKTMNLCTGQKTQDIYENNRFNYSVSSSNFSVDKDGTVHVNPPKSARYLRSTLTITWNVDSLAFSAFPISITVPLIWTDLSEMELKEKFTASVAVGNPIDGYETVWSNRYSRIDTFSLPNKAEILNKINYSSFDFEGINLKYNEISGYDQNEATTGLQLTGDKVYYFDVAPREYTLEIAGVHNQDGTTQTRTYKTTYGNTFDFADLKTTGKNNEKTGEYTSFLNLTKQGNNQINFPLDTPVNLAFVAKFTKDAKLTANYNNNSLTATYTFLGIKAPEVNVAFKKGTAPYFEGITDYVEKHGGAGAVITSVSPLTAPSESSVSYVVNCKVDKPVPKHTINFNTTGGSAIKSQAYPEGSTLYTPTIPRKTGYTFAGWYKDAALTTAIDISTSKMEKQDITVFAKWTADIYKITFISDNATIKTSTIAYNDSYSDLPSPDKKNDYKCIGWYTQKAGGEKVETSTVFKTTNDVILYARWAEKDSLDSKKIIHNLSENTHDYNLLPQPLIFRYNDDKIKLDPNSFKVTYRSQYDETEWTDAIPVDSGTYDVKITRPTDDNYKAVPEQFTRGAIRINQIHQPIDGLHCNAFTRGGTIRFDRPYNVKESAKPTYHAGDHDSTDSLINNLPARSYNCTATLAETRNYLPATIYYGTINCAGIRSGDYNVNFKIKTADVAKAGTDATLTGVLHFLKADPIEVPNLHDITADDDWNKFERNSIHEVPIAHNIVPWQISGYGIKSNGKGTSPQWLPEYNDIILHKEGKLFTHRIVYLDQAPYPDDYKYLDEFVKSGYTRMFSQAQLFVRHIQDMNSFYQGKGNEKIDLNSSKEYRFDFSGYITDQYYTNYDPYTFYGAPNFRVSSKDERYDQFIHYNDLTRFTIDTVGLSEYIKKNGGTNFQYKIDYNFSNKTVGDYYKNTEYIDVTVPTSRKAQVVNANSFEKVVAPAMMRANAQTAPIGPMQALKPIGPMQAPVGPMQAPIGPMQAPVGPPQALIPPVVNEDDAPTESLIPPVVNEDDSQLEPAPVEPEPVEPEPVEPAPVEPKPVLPQKPFVVSVDDAKTKQGEIFDLTFNLNENPSIWGVLANVNYDHDAFELLSCSAGNVFSKDMFRMKNDLNKDKFTFLATRNSLDNTSETGVLVTLKFKVKEEAKNQNYTIDLDILQSINALGIILESKIKDGVVTVNNVIPQPKPEPKPEEEITEPETPLEKPEVKPEVKPVVKPVIKPTVNAPTGDNTMSALWLMLLFASSATIATLSMSKKRKKSKVR